MMANRNGTTIMDRLAAIPKRIHQAFEGADWAVCSAFVLFGLINNILYVIILTAALDLVGTDIPKGMVLLFDVVPSFLTKLTAPYYVHLVPYTYRIWIFVFLSFIGMQCVAFGTTIPWKMFGVVMASISSGGGELTFLAMTHFYGPFSLAFWSTGTGLAGILGGGLYLGMTTWMRLGVRKTLVILGFLPVVMLMSYFLILPREEIGKSGVVGASDEQGYRSIPSGSGDTDEVEGHTDELVAQTRSFPAGVRQSRWSEMYNSVHINLIRARSLFWPFMLPLLLVYISEYTINQGVAPTLLYDLKDMPFDNYRDAYPTYNTIYQLGVFISRSSSPFIRIRHLYPPSILQFVNLAILTAHAVWNFIPSIYIIFIIVFWEGLLGGAVYVNTFAQISDTVPHEDREFSLAATTVSDSGGICIAGAVSMMLETWLCSYQVRHGRKWCKMT